MAKHICIISHQHLCRNPRVLKESIALENVGFYVTILTSVYSAQLLEEDYKLLEGKNIEYTFYNNLIKKDFSSYINRILNKLGRWINKIGFENRWALGYAPTQCFKMAMRQQAGIYICHQELPTYIGTLLLQNGKKVAFDIEDFYSEDLLEKDRKYRPQQLLEKAEKTALAKGVLNYTTSPALAKGVKEKYNSTRNIEVIYNAFNALNIIEPQKQDSTIQLIWLSQTIGPGRGLEQIIQALNHCYQNNFTLNLRGNIDREYQIALQKALSNNLHQIAFLPLIPNSQIQTDLSKYDIGLATELSNPLSRNLTITNKIFHYLSVGLTVIASNTQGQLSLKADFEDNIKYFETDKDLKEILENIDLEQITTTKKAILTSYKKKYDWPIQEKKLQNLIAEIL